MQEADEETHKTQKQLAQASPVKRMSEPATFRERTLNSRYQPRQQLPPNFPEVLKEYAREVLRSQPEDILSWSAAYFKQMALEQDVTGSAGAPPSKEEPAKAAETAPQSSASDLAAPLLNALRSLDSDHNGRLYTRQVRRVLTLSYRLSAAQALYLLSSPLATPQIEDDDTVVYEPCVPNWAPLIRLFNEEQMDFGVPDADDATVHNMSRRDVETTFLQLFRSLDTTGSNRLPFTTYLQALCDANYQLTTRDLRVLSLECDRNNAEDDVDYEREVKLMFDRLALADLFEAFDTQ